MKRKIAVLLAGTLVLSMFGACGSDTNTSDETTNESTSTSETSESSDGVSLTIAW